MHCIKGRAFYKRTNAYIFGLILILFIFLKSWLVEWLDKQRALTYEPQWFLYLSQKSPLVLSCASRWFPARDACTGFLLLFVCLVGLTSAFYWGMFYPVLAPESGTITLLDVLSGVVLFKAFFRKRGIPLEDGPNSKA